METLDEVVISQSIEWILSQPIWLCTVLSTFGSSPRQPGTMMVINASGKYTGSLSGGCIEEDFISRINKGEFCQPSQIVSYGESKLTPNRQLPCGGVVEVLVEFLQPTPNNFNYLSKINGFQKSKISFIKRLTIPFGCHEVIETDFCMRVEIDYLGGEVKIKTPPAPCIIIAGLSVVATYCANFSVSLGFKTIICEPRQDVISDFKEKLSDEVYIENIYPALYLERYSCKKNTAIIAVTHDAKMDDLTMMEAVNTDAFYIGVMGSKNTSNKRMLRLRDFGGISKDNLERIHAPIGINIGSKHPIEIALSIIADIVKSKNTY